MKLFFEERSNSYSHVRPDMDGICSLRSWTFVCRINLPNPDSDRRHSRASPAPVLRVVAPVRPTYRPLRCAAAHTAACSLRVGPGRPLLSGLCKGRRFIASWRSGGASATGSDECGSWAFCGGGEAARPWAASDPRGSSAGGARGVGEAKTRGCSGPAPGIWRPC